MWTVLPSWQMADSDEAGVGVGDVAVAVEAVDEADGTEAAGDAAGTGVEIAIAEVVGEAATAAAGADGGEADETAVALGVLVLTPLVVADNLALLLSALLTPLAAAVWEAGDVSGLKPPLPHTEAGGA